VSMLAPPSPFSAASPFDTGNTGKPVNPFGSQPKTGVGRSANLRRDGNAHALMTPQARKTFLCAHTENSEKSLKRLCCCRILHDFFFRQSVFSDKTTQHHFTFSGSPPPPLQTGSNSWQTPSDNLQRADLHRDSGVSGEDVGGAGGSGSTKVLAD
jgi:hypothetical protein